MLIHLRHKHWNSIPQSAATDGCPNKCRLSSAFHSDLLPALDQWHLWQTKPQGCLIKAPPAVHHWYLNIICFLWIAETICRVTATEMNQWIRVTASQPLSQRAISMKVNVSLLNPPTCTLFSQRQVMNLKMWSMAQITQWPFGSKWKACNTQDSFSQILTQICCFALCYSERLHILI